MLIRELRISDEKKREKKALLPNCHCERNEV